MLHRASLALSLLVLLGAGPAGAAAFFALRTVGPTGAPLGCVAVSTTSNLALASDDSGRIAFYEPGAMNRSIWFEASRTGYRFFQPGGPNVIWNGQGLTTTEAGSGTLALTPHYVKIDQLNPGTITLTVESTVVPYTIPVGEKPEVTLGNLRLALASLVPGHTFQAIRNDALASPTAHFEAVSTTSADPAKPLVASLPPPAEPCSGGDDAGQLLVRSVPTPSERFRIEVRDATTGRGVPLIELRTSKGSHWTDSAGVVSYFDPDWMGQPVGFEVRGHGYAHATGAVTLEVVPGGGATLEVERVNIAERLYRMNGAGIYAETILQGEAAPIAQPLINQSVTGLDTTQSAFYRGRVHWIWGDTNPYSFFLGNFRTTSGTSLLPADGGLEPSVGVDVDYLEELGFVRAMAPPSNFPGDGVVWFGSVFAAGPSGAERLYARYSRRAGLGIAFENGIAMLDDLDAAGQPRPESLWRYVRAHVESGSETLEAGGQPARYARGADDYLYFNPHGQQFYGFFASTPIEAPVRVRADNTDILDPTRYQGFTPIVPGTTDVVERDPAGVPIYGWKADTPILDSILGNGTLVDPEHRLFGHVVDVGTAAPVARHGSSVKWNPYRQRFVEIFTQWAGSSLFGELWYAEADTPVGPWVNARKIVTHDAYTMYNPQYHDFFDEDGGRTIYFDGTYTIFVASSAPTPRYNYNPIMHRLDLGDERLALPVPVYDLAPPGAPPGRFATKEGLRTPGVSLQGAFLAPDRPGNGTVPVTGAGADCRGGRLVAGGEEDVRFHAIPGDAPELPPGVVPLYEYENAATGEHAYSTNPALALPGFETNGAPFVHVWPNPIELPLPVGDFLGELLANAGADVCTKPANLGEAAIVQLDGSASSSAGPVIVDYAWRVPVDGDILTASGPMPQLALPAGLHEATLTVTDLAGSTHEDRVRLDVEPLVLLGISLAPELQVLTQLAPRASLQLTGHFEDGIDRDLGGSSLVEYTASPPGLVTIDEAGVVSAWGAGSVEITASALGFEASVQWTVESVPEDGDGDFVYDFEDNCAGIANPDQADRGGVVTGGVDPGADGIGDACQCGDVDGTGTVDLDDHALLSAALAGTGTLAAPALCSVVETATVPWSCDVDDAQALFEWVSWGAGEIGQVCAPALGLPDGDGDGAPDPGVETAGDNCPGVANPLQADRNGDDRGDACTAACDVDGSGALDSLDMALALGIAAGEIEGSESQRRRADVAPATGGPTNGQVDVADALLVVRAAGGDDPGVCNVGAEEE